MRLFGRQQGRDICEVTLRTTEAEAQIIEFGAVVRDLKIRRRDGAMQRVVLGLNSVEDYVTHSPNFGAIAGRFANRIRHGSFVLDGTRYQLPLNLNGRHTLHGGGSTGFGKCPWTIVHHDTASATLVHVSPDGSNGFPGTVLVACSYTLMGKTLRVALTASTDKPTVINLCQHSYFNLTGAPDILDHRLEVRADVMTPVDADQIPNGELDAVTATPFDFRRARPIRLIDEGGPRFCYDHNFVLRRDQTEQSATPDGMTLAHAATVAAPDASLTLEVWTTEPALQVYDGSKVSVPVPGLDGANYGACAGLCLEPQHVPDSPNLPQFPTTILRPGHLYRQLTEFRFA